MNLTEILEYTRFIINEPQANLWTDAELVNYINRGYEHAYRAGVAADRGYGAIWYDWATVDFAAPVSRKNGLYTIRVPTFIYKVVDIWDGAREYEQIPPGAAYVDDGTFRWWFSGSNEISLATTVVPTSLRIRAYRNPVPLHNGTFTTGGATTAVLSATLGTLSREPWAYSGAKFQLLSGTSVGAIVFATDYNRATSTITYDSTAGAAISTSDTYSMLPDMDSTHHELLAYLAASRAFNKENNVAGREIIRMEVAELWRNYITGIVPRQTQAASRVAAAYNIRTPRTYDRAP